MRLRVCSCWACARSALPLCCLQGSWHTTSSGVRCLPTSRSCTVGNTFIHLWSPLMEWVARAVPSSPRVLDGNVMLEVPTSKRVAAWG